MTKGTSQLVRVALANDNTVRPDQRNAALAVLLDQLVEMPLLLTQAQVAKMLSVSRVTIFRMVRDGELPVVTVRGLKRYRRTDVEALAR